MILWRIFLISIMTILTLEKTFLCITTLPSLNVNQHFSLDLLSSVIFLLCLFLSDIRLFLIPFILYHHYDIYCYHTSFLASFLFLLFWIIPLLHCFLCKKNTIFTCSIPILRTKFYFLKD